MREGPTDAPSAKAANIAMPTHLRSPRSSKVSRRNSTAERSVVSWLTEELVSLGMTSRFLATDDSVTGAELDHVAGL
jgi:hypothetical protein